MYMFIAKISAPGQRTVHLHRWCLTLSFKVSSPLRIIQRILCSKSKSLQLYFCSTWYHYCKIAISRMERNVCLILLHLIRGGNQTFLRPFDLEYNVLSTRPHTPTTFSEEHTQTNTFAYTIITCIYNCLP